MDNTRLPAGKDDTLLTSFLKAEQFVLQSKYRRWTQKPLRYVLGLVWSYLCYPIIHKALPMRCTLFTGDRISVPLPAGLDLYLAGVKSHGSELRLTRYLLSVLKSGDVAIDAGAHVGYFSMVMAACVTEEGAVIAFEPSAKIGEYLKRNTLYKLQVHTEAMMLSAAKGESTFHEFPLRFSEFNTSILRVSEKGMTSKSRVVPTTSLDEYCRQHEITPVFIKIDVEGGEYHILKGAVHILDEVQAIAMELRKSDYEILYAPAVMLLAQFGFIAFRIAPDGSLIRLPYVEEYVMGLTEESDNVVFRKITE